MYVVRLCSLCASSGYDFGYFVKLLTAASLPTTEEAFFELLQTWFPTVYDIKYMMRASNNLKGGLQQVADDLGVRTFQYLRSLDSDADFFRHFIGLAHRAVTPGWVGLALDGFNFLQDA